jgi:epsilon-lactone hydrolase
MASPELQVLVEQLRAQPILTGDAAAMRAHMEMMTAGFAVPDDVGREPLTIGSIPAEWIRPAGAAPDAALLYLHGGGYVIGSISTHRSMIAAIGAAAGLPALAIDYRLAPECPFPAAVEDATASYRWLLDQGIAPGRIAIGGDSAGGGLTIATLVAIRDAGLPMPAAGVCLSPWVDMEAIGDSMTGRATRDPMLDRDRVGFFSRAYLGKADCRSPLAAPLYADLKGLPPLLIQVGEAEVLYDDSVRITERARAAGVDVTLEAWPDMIHVWQFFAPMLPEGRQAIDDIGAFLSSRVGAANKR